MSIRTFGGEGNLFEGRERTGHLKSPSHVRQVQLEEELAVAVRRLDVLVIAARDLRRAQRNYIGRPASTTEDERELLGQKVDAAARALDKAMEPLL